MKQDVVDEMASQQVDVVRRRNGNTTSAVPAAFRRSVDTHVGPTGPLVVVPFRPRSAGNDDMIVPTATYSPTRTVRYGRMVRAASVS